jgi:MFS transporter, OPA family, glycerol-3-phosphate transporter
MTNGTEPTLAASTPEASSERAGWGVMSALAAGYIGIYLCRKNLAVAVPMLQQSFSATKAQIGVVASIGTLAYAAGKVINGPIVDRIGGRRGFLVSLAAVALFGAAGAFAPGLWALTFIYGVNRFSGSAAWGAMVKLVPSWFGPARTGTVVAALSLSYVAGGALATLFARQIVASGGSWRAVMGLPSAALVVIGLLCSFAVRSGPRAPAPTEGATRAVADRDGPLTATMALLRRPQFLVVCALSFTLTLMRESFNTWSVDFLVSIQGGAPSLATAALQSTGFDLAGVISIVGAGYAYDRIDPRRRRWWMAGTLAVLAVVIAVLPRAAAARPVYGAVLVGAIGLLVYGPYSLLAGALAVDSGGIEQAATAAGIIDGVGYLAGALAGAALGRVLDIGGYPLGFRILAVITGVSALISLALRPAAAP